MSATLTACAGTSVATESPLTSPTSSAVTLAGILSESDALERAIEVRAEYDQMLIRVASDPNVDPSLMSIVATEKEVDVNRALQRELQTNGQRLSGLPTYGEYLVQSYEPLTGRLVMLACEDISQVRLLLADGTDVTPPSRSDLISMKITFVVDQTTLKVDESVGWEGASVC